MDKLKIRRYKKQDDLVIWKLHKLGLKEMGRKPSHSNPLDQDFSDIESVYLKDGDFIVGELDGKVVAMGAYKKINEDTVELKRMRVHPDFQRRGFGQAIIEELEKRAKSRGFKKIILDTSQKLAKAQNFYVKNDYKEIGRGKILDKYNVIFYEKKL